MDKPTRSRRRALSTLLAAAAASLSLVFASPAQADSATFVPTADTWVNSAQPTQDNGATLRLYANGDPARFGLVKFAVTGIPAGATNISGVLTLTSPTAQTAATVQVKSVGSTWDENTTWNTRPTPGTLLASGTMPSAGSASFNVPISGNGTVSFAFTRTTAGDSIAASRENTAANQPKLSVSWTPGGGGTVNAAPSVSAGADQSVTLPASANLNGTVSDDGQPAGSTVTQTWTKVSGPGTVTFGNASAVDTTAAFSAAGTYVLRLTASDGALSSSDDVQVTVAAATAQAACGDGADNDGDGKVDYPADPGCTSATDTDEADPVTPPPGGPFIPYGPTSLLQSPIPAGAPVSPDNAFFRSWEQTAEPVDYWKLRVTSSGYAQNYTEGQCTDPVFTIVSTGSVPSGQGFLKTSGFHANRTALAAMAQNSDSPILVRDFCGTSDRPGGLSVWAANVLYDGTTVLKSGGDGTITAGSFDWRTNGLDSRAPSSDAAAGVNMVSRGRIPDSMVITDAELRAGMNGAHNGTAGHSVEVFFVETNTAAGFQEPMVGAESGKVGCGGSAHPGLCAEGQYVRIDPTLPVPAGCTGAAAVVFRTLQQYGGYLGDNSGSGSGIKMQAGTSLVTVNSLQPCMHLNQLQMLTKGYVPPHS